MKRKNGKYRIGPQRDWESLRKKRRVRWGPLHPGVYRTEAATQRLGRMLEIAFAPSALVASWYADKERAA